MLTYADSVALPKELTLGDAQSIAEKLNEACDAKLILTHDRHDIEITIRSSGDLWDLREAVGGVEHELSSRGVFYYADRTKIAES